MKLNTDFFKIKYNNVAPRKGMLLVSEPFAPDYFFKRSVVLITEHNENGSSGFILNKPINKKLPEISSEFGNFDVSVSLGGPVSRENIYYIHTLGNVIPGSINITKNLFWGGEFEILKTIISSGKILKNQIRFFIGYSGWQAKQLETEISKDYWLVTNTDINTIMNYDKVIWEKVVSLLDDKYQIWANFPENPGHN